MRTICVRVEWGDAVPRLWSGLLELSEGRFEQPASLGVDADETGTIQIDGKTLWLRRNSARLYDGLDVTVVAPPDAQLSVTLQSSERTPVRRQLSVEIDQLNSPITVGPKDAKGFRLVIRRQPGDGIPLKIDRPHLIFRPGERFSAAVMLDSSKSDKKPETLSLQWKLLAARTTKILDQGKLSISFQTNPGRNADVPFEITLPEKEGAYDIQFNLLPSRSGAEKRTVQVIVLADNLPRTDPSTRLAKKNKRVDSFNPSDRNLWRRIKKRRGTKLLNGAVSRLLGLSPDSNVPENRKESKSRVKWTAYKLHVRHVGRPHRLIITAPMLEASKGWGQSLGVSLLEPNAAGQLMPVGLESGVFMNNAAHPSLSSEDSSNGKRGLQHEILYWPKIREPVLLLHDMGSGRPVNVSRVELFELPALSRQRTAERRALPGSQRLVGPYMHKPLLPENFGASEAFDPASGRSLDDWVTFHDATLRLADYLNDQGYNSLLLAVMADGSTIYPSRWLDSTPRYDTGVFFATGQDPLRKDVLELLFRVFDREGLVLIPELQFSTPLPELEQMIAAGDHHSQGVELIGSDGRRWRDSRPSDRGLAPYYNPLDPRVQQAVLRVVEEVVKRYHTHKSFRGVALELSCVGYLQLPGLEWGYDDETIARFEKATGIRVPTTSDQRRFGRRHEFLTTRARRTWIEWRSKELARFHRRLANAVSSIKPTAQLVLSGNRILPGADSNDKLSATLKSGGKLKDLLKRQGLDFHWYLSARNVIVLRPSQWVSPYNDFESVLNESINQGPSLDVAMAGCRQGSLFYHVPREFHVPDFDAVSPWQPAYTWLATPALPGGAVNRKRYAHAMAAGDAKMIFDGSWMISMGQESHTRAIRDIIRRIPALSFHRSNVQQQPVVVRIVRHAESTWLYAVNEMPSPVGGSLALSCSPDTTGMELGIDAPLSLASRNGGKSLLRFELKAYGIWACRLNDADVRIERVTVELPKTVIETLQHKIENVDHKLAELRKLERQGRSVLKNPGFESPSTPKRKLVGWDPPVTNAAFWTLDPDNPHSGENSLLLTAGQQKVATVTTEITLPAARHLTISLWLRGDREETRARLVFEFDVDGETHSRSADVRVETRWRRFIFRVKDLPPHRPNRAEVRIELQGAGKIWIDDVDVRTHRFSRSDLGQITKVYSAMMIAWEQRRYTDCQRLLDSYWGKYLFDDFNHMRQPKTRTKESASTAGRLKRFKQLFRR